MRATLLALVALATTAGPLPAQLVEGRDIGIRVTPRSADELRHLESIASSIWNCRYGVGVPLELAVPAEHLRALTDAGLEPVVIVPDVQAAIDAELAQIEAVAQLRNADYFDNFHDYDGIQAFVNQMAADHPDLVSVRTIGNSLEGRPIIAFDLVSPDAPPDAPVVIFNAAQHAREWITPPTVLYIADQLTDRFGHDTRITDVLSTVRIVFVPVVNPDGYHLTWNGQRMWRKNTRDNGNGTSGVDPNRNWSEYFGGTGSSSYGSSEIYHGPAPFSEPETQALRDLALSEPTLVAHIDWHSHGQLLLHPYDGKEAFPPGNDRPFFVSVGEQMVDGIWHTTGTDFISQPGYMLYIASGTCSDWFYQAAGVPSWTFELRGGGFAPHPREIVTSGREMLPAALAFIERSAMPLRTGYPDGMPTDIEPDTPRRIEVSLGDGVESLSANTIGVSVRDDAGQSVALATNDTAPGSIECWLPPTPCGRSFDLVIEAQTTAGSTVRFVHPIRSITTTTYLEDDAESDLGWSYSDPADTATDGHWERGDPERTLLQPDHDTSPTGDLCFVTGAAEEGYDLNNDVDGGTVTLTSPTIDMSDAGALSPVLSYQRWVYSWLPDGLPDQWFRVSISDDDGASWTVIDEPEKQKGGWVPVEHSVLNHIAATDQVRLRFQAHDGGADTPLEMAVDDVRLVTHSCDGCGPADVTTTGAAQGDPGFGVPDGAITGADIQHYINAWVAGDTPAADLTTTGAAVGDQLFGVPDTQVTGADIQYYVNLWIAGCP